MMLTTFALTGECTSDVYHPTNPESDQTVSDCHAQCHSWLWALSNPLLTHFDSVGECISNVYYATKPGSEQTGSAGCTSDV